MLKLKAIATSMMWPAIGILAFIGLEVVEAGGALYGEYSAAKDAESAFYEQQDANNAAAIAAGNAGAVREFEYAGPPTFLDHAL